MFGFAHNGHGALADERDRHRVGRRRGARRSGRRGRSRVQSGARLPRVDRPEVYYSGDYPGASGASM